MSTHFLGRLCNVWIGEIATRWQLRNEPEKTVDISRRKHWFPRERAEIPYWWRVTIQIWVVILIGCAFMEICFNQPDAVTRSWQWHANVIEFLRLLPTSHFAGNRWSDTKCRLFSQAIKRPSFGCCFFSDQFRFVGNCPPTPPLSQHFAQREK